MIEPKTKEAEARKIIENSVSILTEMKAVKLVEYDLREVNNAVADYFLICSGTSSVHVKALADNLYKLNRRVLKASPWHLEGMENREWILLDYVDVVVHVFSEEKRDFYKLEDLWADAKIKKY